MVATVTAAEGGAKVVVFEKRTFPRGSTNMAMGYRVVGADMSEDEKKKDTDTDFNEFMEFIHWRTNARLVRAFLEKTSETSDWLQRHGVDFTMPNFEIEGRKMPIAILKAQGKGHGGAIMIKALVKNAGEKGVKICFATPVKKILKNKCGITGVIAEDKSGNALQVAAKAMIVASVGYGNNKEMIKKYGGFDL